MSDGTVYISTGQAPYRSKVHNDEDCYCLQRAESIREKPLSVFVEPEWCSECGP